MVFKAIPCDMVIHIWTSCMYFTEPELKLHEFDSNYFSPVVWIIVHWLVLWRKLQVSKIASVRTSCL